jgi:hypothetical protein
MPESVITRVPLPDWQDVVRMIFEAFRKGQEK